MTLPPQLEIDIQTLHEQDYKVSVHPESTGGNRILVVIDDYPLPTFWSKPKTRLLIITDMSYPYSKLDMFWVDTDVRLKDGRIPQGGGSFENYLGQDWHRFSWHVQKWNPSFDNIITYLGTIDHRLSQPQ